MGLWRGAKTIGAGAVVLFVCAAMQAAAQGRFDPDALQFERHGVAGGLSHNTVSSAPLLDRRGFLWVGTIDGLNRFDGRDYVVYRPEAHDPGSISNGLIHTIAEDGDGRLWVGTRDGGLNRYDWRTDRFTRFRADPADPNALPSDYVSATLYDADGRLWVATFDRGFGVVDVATGRFRRVDVAVDGREGPLPPGVRLYRRGDGDLWIGTERGLFRMAAGALRAVPRTVAAGDAPVVVPARFVPLGRTVPPHVTAMLEASDGRFWAGTRDAGVFVLGRDGRVLPRTSGMPALQRGYVSSFLEAEGRVWVATQQGLHLADPATGRVRTYRPQPGDPASLSHDNVTYLYRDRTGTVWVATWGGGFCRVRPASPFVGVDAERPGGLSHDFVMAFAEDSTGVVWVGTGGGVNRYDPADASIRVFRADPRRPGSLSADGVWAVEEGRSAFWIGTSTGGINVLPKTALARAAAGDVRFVTVRHDPADPDSPGADNVRALFEDRHGRLWVGLNDDGLDLVPDPAPLVTGGKAHFVHLRHDPTDSTSLSDNGIRTFYEDRRGDLWVGTFRGGACRVRLEGGGDESPLRALFDCLRHVPGDPNSLSHDDVRAIYQDTTGTYWFATYGGGLVAWDEATGAFTRYGRAAGLPNESVYGILDDGLGHLWLTTNNGLARLDLRDRTFRTYTQQDGLQYDEFNTGAWHRGPSGRLYVGGPAGFNHFDPAALDAAIAAPPVYLTGFRVFDAPRRFDRSVAAMDTLVLSHRENFVTFEYVAPVFDEPERVRYTYALEGVDPEPVHAGGRRFAGYTALRPGDYVFRVRAHHADAPAAVRETAVRLVVTPPWWATWWFYALAGAAGLAVVVGGVRYVTIRKWKARVQALEMEHRLQMERERISRDLHDHVGAHLTGLVSGLELVGRYEARDDRPRRDALVAALRVETRQTIEQLRGTIWALNQQAVSAAAFEERLARYAADRNRLLDGCQVVVARTGPGDPVLTPTQALHLFRIAQEAVQNAVKHAGARTIRVVLDAAVGHLVLRVQDNGTFKPPVPGSDGGYGLAGMRRRAAEIGADYRLEIPPGGGTVVTVRLPLHARKA